MNTVPAPFRSRVLSGEWLGGTFLNLGSPVTAELAGRSGFEWVLLDHEHGLGGEETMLHQLQAVASTPAVPIVRIAANEAPRFKRALDAGAVGIMVPYVNTPAEARSAVSSLRYPPRGLRGVARFNRAAGFGRNFDDYFAHAHERLVLMIQVETPEAAANAHEMAAVDGVDVLFVGPLDFTANLGVPGAFDDPRFVEARKAVVAATRASGKAAGILVFTAEQVPVVQEEGFTLVTLGSDGGAVSTVLGQCASTLRRAGLPKGG